MLGIPVIKTQTFNSGVISYQFPALINPNPRFQLHACMDSQRDVQSIMYLYCEVKLDDYGVKHQYMYAMAVVGVACKLALPTSHRCDQRIYLHCSPISSVCDNNS
jgi:hypothetical protein